MIEPSTIPQQASVKNPKRIAAGKRNRAKAAPITEATRQKLRDAIFARKPWLKSTGPKSSSGKKRTAKNAAKTHNTNDTEELIRRVREHAQLLAQLRRTAYVDTGSVALKTTDQLATDLQLHLQEVYGGFIKRLAASTMTT